jgi:PIN domain nuclease of toxin-antitoxin system
MRLLVDTHVFLWFLLDDPRTKAYDEPLIEG